VAGMTPDLSPLRLIAYRALRSLPVRPPLLGRPAAHLARRPALHPGPPATHLMRVILTADSHLVLTPDTGALPGGQVLQGLMNGLDGWALALSLVGLVIGAAAWALGSHGQNYQQSFVGRRAVLISGFAALLIGAGPGIVNFFFNTGQGVH
jgi:hypothetical protein